MVKTCKSEVRLRLNFFERPFRRKGDSGWRGLSWTKRKDVACAGCLGVVGTGCWRSKNKGTGWIIFIIGNLLRT